MSNELSLKDFIKETIKNITDGIYEVKDELYKKYNNVPIAPSIMDGENVVKEQLIKFDIAVTTAKTDSKNANGKIGINVANVGLDGNIESSKTNFNRIQFEVPFFAQALTKSKNKK